LAWAFVEAAHFAVQANERIRKFFQRKAAKKNKVVAIKAVAHKLARASYHVMKDQTDFEPSLKICRGCEPMMGLVHNHRFDWPHPRPYLK
jgi:hypothetical protein